MNQKQMTCIQKIDQIRGSIREHRGLSENMPDIKAGICYLETLSAEMEELEKLILESAMKGYEEIPSDNTVAILSRIEKEMAETTEMLKGEF